jgi:hypothetical protein
MSATDPFFDTNVLLYSLPGDPLKADNAKALQAARRLVAAQPSYVTAYIYLAMNNVALGCVGDARAAIVERERVGPDLSLALMQGRRGVSRPEIDARHNAALRQTGLE